MTYDEAMERYGFEHTHDRECRTWRGPNWNWIGACNCRMSRRNEEES